jgi:hypothetical protein
MEPVGGLNNRDVIWGTSTVSRTCLLPADLCESVHAKWTANRAERVMDLTDEKMLLRRVASRLKNEMIYIFPQQLTILSVVMS